MVCFSCPSSGFKALARAAAKSAAARLRRMGALAVSADWTARLEACARCPMCVMRGEVAYCGNPFLERVRREPAVDGCGCPCREKAKSPKEHCPLTVENQPANSTPEKCDCKWCVLVGNG